MYLIVKKLKKSMKEYLRIKIKLTRTLEVVDAIQLIWTECVVLYILLLSVGTYFVSATCFYSVIPRETITPTFMLCSMYDQWKLFYNYFWFDKYSMFCSTWTKFVLFSVYLSASVLLHAF